MRYPAYEKLEIIRLVEGSHLPVKRTLEQLGVSRPNFYRWYDLYRQFGEAGLKDGKSHPGRVWNRIPDHVGQAMLEMPLVRPELSPRELAVTFTDERNYFVSEASVYWLLKAHDLITSPAFIVMKAASEFRDRQGRLMIKTLEGHDISRRTWKRIEQVFGRVQTSSGNAEAELVGKRRVA